MQPAAPEVTSLLVQPDADATVAIDYWAGVAVQAGQSRRFRVLPGIHFVRATAGEATLEKTVEVKYGEQQAVPLALARLVHWNTSPSTRLRCTDPVIPVQLLVVEPFRSHRRQPGVHPSRHPKQ